MAYLSFCEEAPGRVRLQRLSLLAVGWSSGRGSWEAGWSVRRTAIGKRAKVILKSGEGSPATREAAERVLTSRL